MRVYVACSYAHRIEAARVMRMLIERGHTITHQWVYESIEGMTDEKEIRRFLACVAEEDLIGVSVAEAVVVLHFPENKGTLVEFGYGLKDIEKIIVVVDGDRHYTEVPIFYYLDRVHHEATPESAVDYLTELDAIRKLKDDG